MLHKIGPLSLMVLFLAFLLVLDLHWFALVFAILYSIIVSFFWNDKTKIYMLTMKFTIVILLIISAVTNYPIFMALFAIEFCVFVNTFYPINKIFDVQSITIIALTVIIIGVSFPVFQPKVDIISISEIQNGVIRNETTYGFQEITLSVQPPLIPVTCREIVLGYDTQFWNTGELYYGVRIRKGNHGAIKICSPKWDFTNRVISIKISSRQPVNHGSPNKNLTRFILASEGSSVKNVHLHYTNFEDFPIKFDRDLKFVLNDDTTFNDSHSIIDFFDDNIELESCFIDKFSFSSQREAQTETFVNAKREGEVILLSVSDTINIPPKEDVWRYLQFRPDGCK